MDCFTFFLDENVDSPWSVPSPPVDRVLSPPMPLLGARGTSTVYTGVSSPVQQHQRGFGGPKCGLSRGAYPASQSHARCPELGPAASGAKEEGETWRCAAKTEKTGAQEDSSSIHHAG